MVTSLDYKPTYASGPLLSLLSGHCTCQLKSSLSFGIGLTSFLSTFPSIGSDSVSRAQALSLLTAQPQVRLVRTQKP